MTPATRTVAVAGQSCRVWEAGSGAAIYWLASTPMLYRWTAVHAALAARFRLVVVSLPGMPGNARNHETIDSHLDWCLAARDLLDAAGFEAGDTLLGSSTVGALAAEVAAIWPAHVGRLILIAPHGMFATAEPTADIFALHPRRAAAMLSARPERYAAQVAKPDDVEAVTWSIETARANEATARFLWPLGDTRVALRLGRITAPTLLVWGDGDRIIPPGYAERWAAAMAAPPAIVVVPGGGHLVELDEPEAVAAAVVAFAAPVPPG